jgi:Tfp pilus assembly protein PilV
MFILLVGLLSVITVFGDCVQKQIYAQDTIIAQQLATMWVDWVRFSSNNMSSGVLPAESGNFYTDVGPQGGNNMKLPTYNCIAYRGFTWTANGPRGITNPIQWLYEPDVNGVSLPGTSYAWYQCVNTQSSGFFTQKDLQEVDLTITHGARSFNFTYYFSGVPLLLNKL